MCQDEFAKVVVEREAVDASSLHRDDQLRRRTVHGESRSHHFSAGFQQFLFCSLGALLELVNGEDGTDRHAGVEVGRAVDGIAGHSVACRGELIEGDELLLFFGDEEADAAAGTHGGYEEVIADYVELLLVIAGGVGGAGEAGELQQWSAILFRRDMAEACEYRTLIRVERRM